MNANSGDEHTVRFLAIAHGAFCLFGGLWLLAECGWVAWWLRASRKAAEVKTPRRPEVNERALMDAAVSRLERGAEPPFQRQEAICSRETLEAMIDEAVDETFPASDPPAWTLLMSDMERTAKSGS